MQILFYRLCGLVFLLGAISQGIFLWLLLPVLRNDTSMLSRDNLPAFIIGTLDIPLFCWLGFRCWKHPSISALKKDAYLGGLFGAVLGLAFSYFGLVDFTQFPLSIPFAISTLVTQSLIGGGFYIGMTFLIIYLFVQRICGSTVRDNQEILLA